MGGLTLGDFDEAEVGEKVDAPDCAALEMALVVEHADDVAGADAVIFTEAEEELHHAGLGGVVALGTGLELAALASLLTGLSRLAGFAELTRLALATVARRAGAVFGDLFAFAPGRLAHQGHEDSRDLVPLMPRVAQRLERGDGFFKIPFLDPFGDGRDELLGETTLDGFGGRDLGANDELTGVALDRLDAVDVTTVDERDGFSGTTRAAGPADAVDVVFGILWQLVVEDDIDVIHIDAARRHIGGDEDFDGPLAEESENPLAHGLGDVAVKPVGRVTPGEEFLGAFIDGALRVAENDGEARLLEIDDAGDELDARALARLVADLGDGVDRETLAFDLDELGLVPVALDDAADGVVHCRREKHRLAIIGERAEEIFHFIGKTHVEHAVRLVENGDLDRIEIEGAALNVVDEPAGGADDDLGALT